MTPSYTVQEIIQLCFPTSAKLVGSGETRIEGVSDLSSAQQSQLSFFANERYLADMRASHAGAIILTPESLRLCSERSDISYILHENPNAAFQEVLTLFQGQKKPHLTGFTGIHPTAVIHEKAEIPEGVEIGPYAVVDEGVRIGQGTTILPHVYIGRNVRIGADCVIHAHAVIREECEIQDRVIIQPGAIIGSCGFGYSTDAKGQHTKLHHWGHVVIENDVEIGANTAIDRGRFQATKIGVGTKIDNLVQIAHNVIIGRHCFIVSQVGIAGSAKLGNNVVLAGKVAINGHIDVCDRVLVAACSGVSKSIKEAGKYSGIPVQKLEEYNKNAVYLRKVGQLFDRVKELEKAIRSTHMISG